MKGFYDAGCRYLQFDDTVWAYLCSQEELRKARERMSNVDQLQDIYARVINAALEGKPADMTITTHVCRGNFRSTWISEGGYEPVAETLLGKVNYDGYFLEYDSDRAGGFEPLRFLPKGNKTVVLGLVTSKSGTLEKKDDVKRRIDEAAKFAPLEQFCLSPQCGFASTEEGNVLAEEEQWAKLRMIKELADEVWKWVAVIGAAYSRCILGRPDATNQSAIPRRSCRQPVAPGAAQGGAGEAREGRDHRRSSSRQVEDREIEKIIKKQEEVGLKLATDGEFRRSWWQFDFYKGLDGVELYYHRPGHHLCRGRDQGRERARRRTRSISPAIRTSSISASSRAIPAWRRR